MLNTVILVLLAVYFLAYDKLINPKEQLWFVSYEWVKQKERGVGRTCMDTKSNDFDVVEVETAIRNENRFDTLIINNFMPINRKTYTLCKKPPKK